MCIAESGKRSLPIGAIVVFLVALFLYGGLMANIGEIQNPMTDSMGRGLAQGFAMILAIGEWIVLAILLLIGGINGAMPSWSAMAALVLHPLSGVATAILTVDILGHAGSPLYQLVPGLLPPIIAFYALWARFPALHRRLPPLPVSLLAWIAVALLSAVPMLLHDR